MWIECSMRVDLIATCAARASRRSANKNSHRQRQRQRPAAPTAKVKRRSSFDFFQRVAGPDSNLTLPRRKIAPLSQDGIRGGSQCILQLARPVNRTSVSRVLLGHSFVCTKSSSYVLHRLSTVTAAYSYQAPSPPSPPQTYQAPSPPLPPQTYQAPPPPPPPQTWSAPAAAPTPSVNVTTSASYFRSGPRPESCAFYRVQGH